MLSFLEMVLSAEKEFQAKLGPDWLKKMVQIQILEEKFKLEDEEKNCEIECLNLVNFILGEKSEQEILEESHERGWERGSKNALRAFNAVFGTNYKPTIKYPGYTG